MSNTDFAYDHRFMVMNDPNGTTSRPRASVRTKSVKVVASSRTGPTAERTTNHRRGAGPSVSGSSRSHPAASSGSTAARDNSATPSPARAACLIAPLEPSVRVVGLRPRSTRNCSPSARVPDPGSRSSQVRCASSPAPTGPAAGSGSSAPVMHTMWFSSSGSATRRSSAGGVPENATSAAWLNTRSKTYARLPTSRVSSTSGCRKANTCISGGTNDSAAVVTAAMHILRAATSAASRAACRPSSSSPTTSSAYALNASPAFVSWMPRPARSNSSHPSSRPSAAIADETDGCVTTSSSAAAVTDPPRTTAKNAVS